MSQEFRVDMLWDFRDLLNKLNSWEKIITNMEGEGPIRIGVGIDLQNDFCDPAGSLYIPDSQEDTKRAISVLTTCDFVLITADNHTKDHISFYTNWVPDVGGKPIQPFDILGKNIHPITHYVGKVPGEFISWGSDTQVFPEHCVSGSWGAQFIPELLSQLNADTTVTWLKGENPTFEMFSPFMATNYSGTYFNLTYQYVLLSNLLFQNKFNREIQFVIVGQAKTHCVAHAIGDLCNYLEIRKVPQMSVVVLEDAMTPIPGHHPKYGWVKETEFNHVKVQYTTTAEFLNRVKEGK